ncbi:MAG: HAS-barrel domain-containing protein, partial [Microcystis panniformis]
MSEQPLGSVIQGSLSEGLEIRLYPDISVEDMRVGKFLVVQGTRSRFFCLLTDVSLGNSSPRIIANPPHPDDSFMRDVLAGSGTYGTIELSPMLMFTPTGGNSPAVSDTSLGSFQPQTSADLELLPVKTI